ncbi:MAG TPA: glycoside hydrolase family 3 C-terminal domain-containing protein [Opitutaceae bacterium]|nr:glycoside hydrolase family 3 C-terminal domain-containing protein [Opitutaceae bacterium]
MITTALAEPSFKTPVSYEEADRRAGEVLAQMTTAERLELISGHNSFFIKGFPRLGIPELYLSDATQGVNIRRNLSNALEKSVAFPAAIGLAATWDPNLAYRYARSIGEECRAGGIAVLLGPGMNIYRQSQCGRNFEYFGEDPFLAAKMVERYVTGVLDTGTIPTLKHFYANNTDHHRRTSNSILDERTAHEIYLPAFKAGIDAGAMAVMTSYNQVNGEWAGQSERVISELLRRDLGFRWLVMTDWWSVWDAEKIIKSGQDLEMPGEKFLKADAARLLQAGTVTASQIDRMARSILRTEIAMGVFDRPVRDDFFLSKYAEHEQVALQTAREAIVLLKNDGGVLPLAKAGAGRILLTGFFCEKLPRGGGSGEVEGYNNVTLLEALRATYGERVDYAKAPSDEQLKAAAVVLLSTGTLDSEGWDRPFALPAAEEQRVRRTVELNPRTVVLINSGGAFDMTGWSERAAAIVHAWYPGQSGNTALAEILCGDVNPSGKLPITIERRFEDSPGCGYLHADDQLYHGWEPDNDMGQPIRAVEYKEGVFVGYRWYEAKRIAPLFAFGHGLSYTTFAYSDIKVSPAEFQSGERVTVEFAVTNTGPVAGTEVTQLYVRDVEASVPRPVKELKGFARVELAPGERRVVRLRLRPQDFTFWDAATRGWKVEPGEFRVLVGGASDRTPLEARVELK